MEVGRDHFLRLAESHVAVAQKSACDRWLFSEFSSGGDPVNWSLNFRCGRWELRVRFTGRKNSRDHFVRGHFGDQPIGPNFDPAHSTPLIFRGI